MCLQTTQHQKTQQVKSLDEWYLNMAGTTSMQVWSRLSQLHHTML